ncbi:MAG: hypothetical protein ACJ748_08150 [Flavisolibacter sp.]
MLVQNILFLTTYITSPITFLTPIFSKIVGMDNKGIYENLITLIYGFTLTKTNGEISLIKSNIAVKDPSNFQTTLINSANESYAKFAL